MLLKYIRDNIKSIIIAVNRSQNEKIIFATLKNNIDERIHDNNINRYRRSIIDILFEEASLFVYIHTSIPSII